MEKSALPGHNVVSRHLRKETRKNVSTQNAVTLNICLEGMKADHYGNSLFSK